MKTANSNLKAINELNLTTGEKFILSSLIDALYAEAGFSDVSLEDISIGVDIKSAKGYYGSLCKKGICESEDEFGTINLKMKFWYLHIYWNEELQANPDFFCM